MKIRIMGTADELAAAERTLRIAFDVHEVSRPYANHGTSKLARLYVEAALAPDETTAPAPRQEAP